MTFGEWLTTCEAVVELHTRARLRQTQAGEHRSVATGKGLRLRHYEAYRPGDERRLIDWKASRKEHTLLLRRFEAERRLAVVALCDVSASMLFGQHFPKHRMLLDCAGLLGLATLRQGDAFGLLAFATDTVAYFPPQQRRETTLQALEYLWTYAPPGEANAPTLLAPVLQYLPTHQPLLLCLLSDFRMPDWQETLDVLSATHDTIAVCIAEETEIALEAVGHIVVRDLESGQLMELDTASTACRRAYYEYMLTERRAREQLLQRACGAQYVMAHPTTDYRGDLLRLFLARTARTWI
jgi:uncharacterized protein (DUF58 family)